MKLMNYVILVLIGTLFFNLSSGALISEPSFCCQRSLGGGTCLNLPESQCDSGFLKAPTSCESTSFCKLGTCYDSREGVCMENVPQETCNSQGGTWSDKDASELAVCQPGCCIIADQAAFVPLVRCSKLSSSFGVNMDFRPSVTSEVECIALANSQDEGACVTYSASGINECVFTTRGECGAPEGVIALNKQVSELERESGKEFFKDTLCSLPELQANVARQTTTGCYKGMVYWFDDKGNRENVYSSDKDKSWNNGKTIDPDRVCSPTGGSKDCGNCDYLLGSTCSEWSGFLNIGGPKFGNYFCKKTECTDMDGIKRKNGESWCVYDIEPGRGFEEVGSRHFRQICVDGEIVTDPCDDFRNQICVHTGIPTSEGEFSMAACRANRWQDCSSQTLKRNCENIDVRDCIWTERPQGMNFSTGGAGNGGMTNPIGANPMTNPTAQGGSSFDQGMQTMNEVGNMAGQIRQAMVIAPLGMPINLINSIVSSGVGQWEIDFDLLNKVTKFNKTDEIEEGLCVPMIPPGTKFWTGEDDCSVASATCEVNITVIERKDTLTGSKKKSYKMEENECLKEVKGEENVYEPIKTWALKVNAICTSMGDCGANTNINGVYTDWGYLWKYNNDSFSLGFGGFSNKGFDSLVSGKAIVNLPGEYIFNDEIKLDGDKYVIVNGNSNYGVRKISELNLGDIFVFNNEEVLIESIEVYGQRSVLGEQNILGENSDSLVDSIFKNINGKGLDKPVVSGGSNLDGLSLGEYGTAVKVGGVYEE